MLNALFKKKGVSLSLIEEVFPGLAVVPITVFFFFFLDDEMMRWWIAAVQPRLSMTEVAKVLHILYFRKKKKTGIFR